MTMGNIHVEIETIIPSIIEIDQEEFDGHRLSQRAPLSFRELCCIVASSGMGGILAVLLYIFITRWLSKA
jgi:hypothetical protein